MTFGDYMFKVERNVQEWIDCLVSITCAICFISDTKSPAFKKGWFLYVSICHYRVVIERLTLSKLQFSRYVLFPRNFRNFEHDNSQKRCMSSHTPFLCLPNCSCNKNSWRPRKALRSWAVSQGYVACTKSWVGTKSIFLCPFSLMYRGLNIVYKTWILSGLKKKRKSQRICHANSSKLETMGRKPPQK